MASVAGMRFSTGAVAAGLGEPLDPTENRCQRLARSGLFLQANGTERWPDGTSASRYSFNHALYQNVIYSGLNASTKARLHHAISERLEAGYQGATDDIAAELAVHFERAGDQNRAVTYLCQATQRAVRQCGYQEAINYANAGLRLLESFSPSLQRNELELSLQFFKGLSLASSKGYASAESREPFSRARSLSEHVRNDALAFQTLASLWSFEIVRGKSRAALEVGQRMLSLARRTRNPTFFLIGHMTVGVAFFYLGNLMAAYDHLNKSVVLHRKYHSFETSTYGWDPGVTASCYRAKTVWLLGYPQKADSEAKRAISLTRKLSSPFHAAFSNGLLAAYYGYRGYENEALQSHSLS